MQHRETVRELGAARKAEHIEPLAIGYHALAFEACQEANEDKIRAAFLHNLLIAWPMRFFE